MGLWRGRRGRLRRGRRKSSRKGRRKSRRRRKSCSRKKRTQRRKEIRQRRKKRRQRRLPRRLKQQRARRTPILLRRNPKPNRSATRPCWIPRRNPTARIAPWFFFTSAECAAAPRIPKKHGTRWTPGNETASCSPPRRVRTTTGTGCTPRWRAGTIRFSCQTTKCATTRFKCYPPQRCSGSGRNDTRCGSTCPRVTVWSFSFLQPSPRARNPRLVGTGG
mmetsp:Transcript_2966/g.11256  ORF Transcript_2966/g.11256 Transcript_2966/m.11256 type:complete len:219 (-) Transcript_2966:145-801(-)